MRAPPTHTQYVATQFSRSYVLKLKSNFLYFDLLKNKTTAL